MKSRQSRHPARVPGSSVQHAPTGSAPQSGPSPWPRWMVTPVLTSIPLRADDTRSDCSPVRTESSVIAAARDRWARTTRALLPSGLIVHIGIALLLGQPCIGYSRILHLSREGIAGRKSKSILLYLAVREFLPHTQTPCGAHSSSVTPSQFNRKRPVRTGGLSIDPPMHRGHSHGERHYLELRSPVATSSRARSWAIPAGSTVTEPTDLTGVYVAWMNLTSASASWTPSHNHTSPHQDEPAECSAYLGEGS